MPTAEHITETVHRYVNLVAAGTADDVADLYAQDATLQDPVGGEIHTGREAIRAFYAPFESLQRHNELTLIRVAGNEAAFGFRLTVTSPEGAKVLEPVVVMAFNGDGKVAAMKAYWSPDNVTEL
jgi:steroid Delta-isomerase